MLTFSPFPHWNVERLKIGMADIEQVELVQKPQGASNGFAYGFGVGWTIVGLLGAAGSRYNTNFSIFALAAPLSGLLVGLASAVIGGASDLSTPTKFNFTRLPRDLKLDALARIMGLRAVARD